MRTKKKRGKEAPLVTSLVFWFFFSKLEQRTDEFKFLRTSFSLGAARRPGFPTKLKITSLISNRHKKLNLSQVFSPPEETESGEISWSRIISAVWVGDESGQRHPDSGATRCDLSTTEQQLLRLLCECSKCHFYTFTQTARYFSESCAFKCGFVFVPFAV